MYTYDGSITWEWGPSLFCIPLVEWLPSTPVWSVCRYLQIRNYSIENWGSISGPYYMHVLCVLESWSHQISHIHLSMCNCLCVEYSCVFTCLCIMRTPLVYVICTCLVCYAYASNVCDSSVSVYVHTQSFIHCLSLLHWASFDNTLNLYKQSLIEDKCIHVTFLCILRHMCCHGDSIRLCTFLEATLTKLAYWKWSSLCILVLLNCQTKDTIVTVTTCTCFSHWRVTIVTVTTCTCFSHWRVYDMSTSLAV